MKKILALLFVLLAFTAMAQPPVLRTYYTTNSDIIVSNAIKGMATNAALGVIAQSNAYNGTFTGNGGGLTNLPLSTNGFITAVNATNITQGIIAGSNSYNGTFVGNGVGVTNVQATNISGTLPLGTIAVATNNATGPALVLSNNAVRVWSYNGNALTNLNGTFAGDISVNGITMGKGVGSNLFNTVVGLAAGGSSGQQNVSMGYAANQFNTANYNVAIGAFAMSGAGLSGDGNVAIGRASLQVNKSGYGNVAIGAGTMTVNNAGYNNMAFGSSALSSSTNSYDCVAIGNTAMRYATNTFNDVAIGSGALANCQNAANVAIGSAALTALITGSGNVAIGNGAGENYVSGFNNVDIGLHTGMYNVAGSGNVNVGLEAGAFLADGVTRVTNANTGIHIGNTAYCLSNNATGEIMLGVGAGNGSHTMTLGGTNITTTLIRGNTFITNTLTVSNVVHTGTPGLYVASATSGVAGASNSIPLGLYCGAMSSVTNTYTGLTAATYYSVTNFQTIRTNGFVFNAATGYGTNLYAGVYRISGYLSVVPGNSDTLEAEFELNGVGREEISMFAVYDNPARVRTMASVGLLYFPANSYFRWTIKNVGGGNITTWRAAIVVGTP